MNVADIMQQTGALDSISRELGIDSGSARTGAEALLPAILGGFKKQAEPAPGGLGGLINTLGGMGGGNLLEAVAGDASTPSEPGNEILGQIFGSKDVSRAVAGQASQTTGVDSGLLKKMLPLLAMAVTGYLASQKSDASASSSEPQRGGLSGMLGQVLGGVMGSGQSGGRAEQGSGRSCFAD